MVSRQFIPDKALLLNETEDLLCTRQQAEHLVRVVEHLPEGEVALGLYGRWGTGKSTIVETALQSLDAQTISNDEGEYGKKGKKFFVVRFDAWKYEGDSFLRMMLRTLQRELKLNTTEEFNRLYCSRTNNFDEISRNTTNIGIAFFLLLIVWLLVSCGILKIEPASALSSGAFFSFLLAIVSGVLLKKYSTLNPVIAAKEQFEDIYKEIINFAFLLPAERHEKGVYVTADETTPVISDRLIIFVDNIDRCLPDNATRILSEIKTFMASSTAENVHNVLFLIPTDDGAINDKDLLKKVFTLSVRMKEYGEVDLLHYATELNHRYELNYKRQTLFLIVQAVNSDPRSVIQILNLLTTELNRYDDNYGEVYETEICFLLIIRTLWPEYAKLLARDYEHLTSNSYTTDEAEKDKYVYYDQKDFLSFVRHSKEVLSNWNSDVVKRVYSNTLAIFNSLPKDIVSAVRNWNETAICEYLDVHRVSLDDVISLAEMTISMQSTETSEDKEFINMISLLNERYGIPANRLQQIWEYEQYVFYAGYCLHADAMCLWANQLGSNGLLLAITDYVKESSHEKETNYHMVRIAAFHHWYADFISSQWSSFVEKYFLTHDIEDGYSDAEKIVLFDEPVWQSRFRKLQTAQHYKVLRELGLMMRTTFGKEDREMTLFKRAAYVINQSSSPNKMPLSVLKRISTEAVSDIEKAFLCATVKQQFFAVYLDMCIRAFVSGNDFVVSITVMKEKMSQVVFDKEDSYGMGAWLAGYHDNSAIWNLVSEVWAIGLPPMTTDIHLVNPHLLSYLPMSGD